MSTSKFRFKIKSTRKISHTHTHLSSGYLLCLPFPKHIKIKLYSFFVAGSLMFYEMLQKEEKNSTNIKKLCFSFLFVFFFRVVFCSFILFMCDNFCHKDMGKNSRKIYWQPSYMANRILSYNVCNNKPTKIYIL